MSRRLELKRIRCEDREYIRRHLTAAWVTGEMQSCFDVDDNDGIYVPFAFGHSTFKSKRDLQPSTSSTTVASFVSNLRPAQTKLVDDVNKQLDMKKCIIIEACTGFGKTVCAIKIIADRGLRACVVCNRIMIMEQWQRSFQKHAPSLKAVIVSSTTGGDVFDGDVAIVNAVNIPKRSRSYWSSIDVLVVDELHQIVTKTYTPNLLLFEPQFIIGLSATPYRTDDYHKVIGWIFGDVKVGEPLNRKHSVEYIQSDFIPVRRFVRGKLDWNEVLNSQASDVRRNELIVRLIVERVVGRTWIVLVKRVSHAVELERMFKARNIVCSTLVGSSTTFDENASVLIGTTSKIGVGFDHANVDSLCIAADVDNYFVQFLGRCMRRPECHPLVLDIVDDFGPLRRHFDNRRVEYERHGGNVVQITA